MKLPENILHRVSLAVLPLLFQILDFPTALRTGVTVVMLFWVTLLFFWCIRRCFPARVLQDALFLWLIAWAQGLWALWGFVPYSVISVFYLMPRGFLDPSHAAYRMPVWSGRAATYAVQQFWCGIAFLALIAFVAAGTYVAGIQAGMRIFRTPAGLFLFMAAAALFWKKQPGRQS